MIRPLEQSSKQLRNAMMKKMGEVIEGFGVIIPQSEWEWFGTPGHFICGHWCRFHLCTKVGGWLISTVGAYVHPGYGGGTEIREREWLNENWPGEDIGVNRKYETMVFRCGERCVVKKCGCNMPEIVGSEEDSRGYNVAGEAAVGHLELCLKYAAVEGESRP